jgi:hypothetical protein
VKPVASKLTLVLPLVGAGLVLSAHDVISTKITWSREISRIVYKRCASCHREGGAAFSLMTYQEARPWAKAIKEEVLERRMPPFSAIKGFGELRNDHALTQEELHLIADWVEGGSPEGEPTLMPKAPDFSLAAAEPGEKPPKTGAEVVVDGRLELTHSATFVAARAKGLAEGASVKAIAQLPDGVIEQLIWIYDYKPKYDQTYYFLKPIEFPAGTKIETYPSGGSLALLTKK